MNETNLKADTRPLVLLVHGLGGDGIKTWEPFLKLIQDDTDIKDRFEIAYYEYPTDIIRWWPFQRKSVRIQDLANSIRTEMDVRYQAHKSVVLVCHSLGGIIAKKYIIEELKKRKSLRVVGLLLYAPPNTGADLARWGDLISWEHPQLKQLQTDSDLLESIAQDWKDWECDAAVKTREVFGGQDTIVSRPPR